MALRDQPYFPLYVQDYLTDEKLNMCSAATQGVYIKIMCIFHKSERYGGILLKQKDKQNENICFNFATKFVKLLPFDLPTIESALNELIDEKVLSIDGDFLFQKRMVKDNDISIKRATAGKKGGEKTQDIINDFAKANIQANIQANSEYENENEIEIDNTVVIVKTWKTDYETYKSELLKVFQDLIIDKDFITKQEKYNPNVDISLSLEKAVYNYWITEAGWKKKKQSRAKEIDWKTTLTNAIGMNKVYKQNIKKNSNDGSKTDNSQFAGRFTTPQKL